MTRDSIPPPPAQTAQHYRNEAKAALFDEVVGALWRIVSLDDHAHPGLSTWMEFRRRAHENAKAVIAKVDALK